MGTSHSTHANHPQPATSYTTPSPSPSASLDTARPVAPPPAVSGDFADGVHEGEHSRPKEDSTSEEEVESFEGWRSNPASSSGRASLEGPRAMSSQQGQPCDSNEAASSTGWLGQRPSADTPLPRASSGSQPPKAAVRRASGGLEAAPPLPLPQRASTGGSTDRSCESPAASARSSFALERASAEANRASLEAFRDVYVAPGAGRASGSAPPQQAYASLELAGSGVTLKMMLEMAEVPDGLGDRYAALCVLPAQTPAPLHMLSLLWGVGEYEAGRALAALAECRAVNVARLPGGQVWALPQAQQLQLLHLACKGAAPAYHAQLLDAYAGAAEVQQVPDDGYFLANVVHHLLGAGRARAVRALLLDPGWLEKKLVACGVAAVVADFRRLLMHKADKEVKLVLEAFQMSAGLVAAHAGVPGLLRCAVAARLMTVPLSPVMRTWLAAQRAAVYADGEAAAAAGLPRCLPPLTPSLDQAGGLQRLALRGHRGAVTRVLLTPSGNDAVTASADGTARVWDLEIGDCVLVLDGHTGPVTGMAITADGSLTVTCSEDGTARAYEMERGQCLRVLAGHEGGISAMTMDPFGRFVATGGGDGTVRVWDLATAQALHVLRAPRAVRSLALSPCTRYLVVGCADGTARMYNVASGQAMGELAGHESWVAAVEFLPDGKHVATASHDGTARLWSLRSGACKHVLTGHTGRINALRVSPDGRRAATASDDGTARVWDLRSGDCERVLQAHRAWVSDVAFSPAGDRLVTASGDAAAITWGLDTGEVVRVLEGHSGPVLGAAFTRRGRFAVTVSEDGCMRVWDFTASAANTPRWHEGRIRALAARDGLVVATAGDDCVARLWDSALGEYKGLLRGHSVPIRWALFSEDGATLVTASPDRCVLVWDCATAECVRRMPVHKGSRMKSFAASGDLSRAVVCLFDSTVTVWDLESMEPLVALQRWGERDEHTGHTSAVNEVLMTSDGATVVTLSKDATARIWDTACGACRHVLRGHSDGLAGGCLSDRGGLLATFAYDNSVRLWSLDGGPCLVAIPLNSGVTRMALSSCGWRLAVALADGGVVLADLDKPQAAMRLSGHSGEVTGLSFSADGRLLASSSMDCSLRLWRVADGALGGLFASDCGLTCCHYDSATECVVLGTDRGVVHFVDAARRGGGSTGALDPGAGAHAPEASTPGPRLDDTI